MLARGNEPDWSGLSWWFDRKIEPISRHNPQGSQRGGQKNNAGTAVAEQQRRFDVLCIKTVNGWVGSMRWKEIGVAFGCPYRRQQAQRGADWTSQKDPKIKSQIKPSSWSSNRHPQSQSLEDTLLPHQQVHPNQQQISQWENWEISNCQSFMRTQ